MPIFSKQIVTSWGLRKALSHIATPSFAQDLSWPLAHGPYLGTGLGRSYGDSALISGGTAVSALGLKRILHFDPHAGVLRAEAGLSLYEILEFLIPHGFFLPVVPGTQYVTLAGAVANDIHGKNHHRYGNFGHGVRCFELVKSSGERFICSREKNSELFFATLGGLGLTGFITWVEIQLPRIASSLIDQEIIPYSTLDEYFDLSARSEASHEFTMSWVDVLSSHKGLLKGLFMRGNFSPSGPLKFQPSGRLLRVPFDLPSATLNTFSVKAFNALYARKGRWNSGRSQVSYRPFFFPLDSVLYWNRIYGRRGFYQYQMVVPPQTARAATEEILNQITRSGEGSFLAVLKNFGAIKSEGLLSFPREGVTLALDFRDRGPETLKLFERLDTIVFEAGGALYPAKDARMSPEAFERSVGGEAILKKFIAHKDPNFSSDFWRRVVENRRS